MNSSGGDTVELLRGVLRKYRSRPMTYKERTRISTELEKAIATNLLSDSDELIVKLKQRLEFSYIPPISAPSFLDPDRDEENTVTTDTSEIPESTNECGPSILPNSSDMENESISVPFVHRSVPSDRLMQCIIHRERSSMRTSFRLYISEQTAEGTPMCKESNFLLGSKSGPFDTGLSHQYLVWTAVDVKEWKEKNAMAKISKSNANFCASILRTESPAILGQIAVSVRSPEKLVQVNAALVLSTEIIDEDTLIEVLEVCLDSVLLI